MRSRRHEQTVTRADYALPKGVPALQADPARTRRWFIILGAACFGLGAAGVALLGTRDAPPRTDPARERRLDWARRCAAGPEHVLHEKADMLLSVVELYGGDPLIWSGVERIVRRALDTSRENPAWSQRVLMALDSSPDLPASLAPLRVQLERVLRSRR